MSDPFDEAPHTPEAPRRNSSTASNGSGSCNSHHHSSHHKEHFDRMHEPDKLAIGSASEKKSSSGHHHHQRLESQELDHMEDSVFSPFELCPHCQQPRMSSIYCSVSLRHHGTDAPMPSATPEKKSGGWSLFKTKEEKERIKLEDEETDERKRGKLDEKGFRKELHYNWSLFVKQVQKMHKEEGKERETLLDQARKLMHNGSETCKDEKRDFDELERIFKLETEVVKKSEREQKEKEEKGEN